MQCHDDHAATPKKRDDFDAMSAMMQRRAPPRTFAARLDAGESRDDDATVTFDAQYMRHEPRAAPRRPPPMTGQEGRIFQEHARQAASRDATAGAVERRRQFHAWVPKA